MIAKEEESIRFKSAEPYFSKEKCGVKNNTVRYVDHNDERFKTLMRWYLDNSKGKSIKIVNSQDENNTFTRKIKDITFFNNFVIITWEHK